MRTSVTLGIQVRAGDGVEGGHNTGLGRVRVSSRSRVKGTERVAVGQSRLGF